MNEKNGLVFVILVFLVFSGIASAYSITPGDVVTEGPYSGWARMISTTTAKTDSLKATLRYYYYTFDADDCPEGFSFAEEAPIVVETKILQNTSPPGDNVTGSFERLDTVGSFLGPDEKQYKDMVTLGNEIYIRFEERQVELEHDKYINAIHSDVDETVYDTPLGADYDSLRIGGDWMITEEILLCMKDEPEIILGEPLEEEEQEPDPMMDDELLPIVEDMYEPPVEEPEEPPGSSPGLKCACMNNYELWMLTPNGDRLPGMHQCSLPCFTSSIDLWEGWSLDGLEEVYEGDNDGDGEVDTYCLCEHDTFLTLEDGYYELDSGFNPSGYFFGGSQKNKPPPGSLFALLGGALVVALVFQKKSREN